MAGTWTRRNRNRPGPTHGIAGMFVRRVPGYPSNVQYGAPKAGVYVDLYTHWSSCATRLLPLDPADYGATIDNTPIHSCLRATPCTGIHTRHPYQRKKAALLHDEPGDRPITRSSHLSTLLFADRPVRDCRNEIEHVIALCFFPAGLILDV